MGPCLQRTATPEASVSVPEAHCNRLGFMTTLYHLTGNCLDYPLSFSFTIHFLFRSWGENYFPGYVLPSRPQPKRSIALVRKAACPLVTRRATSVFFEGIDKL